MLDLVVPGLRSRPAVMRLACCAAGEKVPTKMDEGAAANAGNVRRRALSAKVSGTQVSASGVHGLPVWGANAKEWCISVQRQAF